MKVSLRRQLSHQVLPIQSLLQPAYYLPLSYRVLTPVLELVPQFIEPSQKESYNNIIRKEGHLLNLIPSVTADEMDNKAF